MPIPGPGTAISMNTIVAEFGGTAPHSLSEYYRGGGLVPNVPQNAAIPTSGAISMGNFYGATNRTPVSLTITGNTYNYDVFANRGPTYVAGISDVVVTVNPGVTVGSTSTGTFAMLVPSGFSPTDTITIVNNGVIQGMGGGGGGGGSVPGSISNPTPGGPGAGGGNAISVSRPTVITNNGTVAGGGGGGGGGAGRYTVVPKGAIRTGGGGGGGGAGFNGGGGGSGGSAPAPAANTGIPGSPGTSAAGGAGGPNPVSFGGSGGGRGAAGSAGGPSGGAPGGSGGGAGNYIVGNPFVTWPVTGTRQGGVA